MKLSALPAPSDKSPDWKPDPMGGTLYRYWDGSKWTSYVDPSPTSSDPHGGGQFASGTRYPPIRRGERTYELVDPETVDRETPELSEELKALDDEGRIRRSWRLTKIAWQLVRSSRACLVLAILGLGSTALATGLILVLGGYFESSRDTLRLAVVGGIGFYATTFAGAFFNVALARAASAALEGKSMSVGEAIDEAKRRLRQIMIWSFVAATVGLILDQLARRVPLGARVATWLVGAAWGLATMFVIPILAVEEDAEALPSIRRSTQLLRERWAEGLTGSLVIGAWSFVVFIPLVIVFCAASAAAADGGAGTLLLVAGVEIIAIVVVSAALAALRQVFTVVLYRYATTGAAGGFPVADLEHPFTGKKTTRQQAKSIFKWIGITVGSLLAFLIVLGAIVGGRDDGYVVSRDGYFHVSYPLAAKSQIHKGSPVIARGQRIGEIFNEYEEDGALFVVYHLSERYRELGWRSKTVLISGPSEHRYLHLVPGPWGTDGLYRAFSSTSLGRELRVGMPVVFDGQRVGYIQDWLPRNRSLDVIYALRPGHEALGQRVRLQLESSKHPFIRIERLGSEGAAV